MPTLLLKFKTLSGQSTELTVESDDIIENIMHTICDNLNITESVKFVHSGKILNPKDKLDIYGVKNRDCIVVMKVPKKDQTFVPPNPAPEPIATIPPPSSVQTHGPQMQNMFDVSAINIALNNQNDSMSNFWQSESEEDSDKTYSLEDIHLIISNFIAVQLQPIITNGIVAPAIAVFNTLGPNSRKLIKDIADTVEQQKNGLKQGIVTPLQVASTLTQYMNPDHENDDSDYDDETDTETDDGNETIGNQNTEHIQNVPISADVNNDEKNILTIMDMTGATFNTAKESYFACGKNIENAVNFIFDNPN